MQRNHSILIYAKNQKVCERGCLTQKVMENSSTGSSLGTDRMLNPSLFAIQCGHIDVGDFMLMTIFGCWGQNFDIGDIF